MNITTFLNLTESDKRNIKVNFSNFLSKSHDGLNAFYNNNFASWQEQQIKYAIDRNFLLCFVFIEENEWLFVGVYEVVPITLFNRSGYQTLQITEFGKEFIGRLVVKYDRIHRKEQINLENCEEFIQIYEVLRNKKFTSPFKNFNEVKLSYKQLCLIVHQEDYSWKKALSETKGVYLVTDIKSGRFFVGAAYGENSLWDCWVSYVKTGHGGDRALRKVIAIHGNSYADNFQFSVLEVKELYKSNEEIIQREAYWKEVLMTREFGYNIV